MTNAAALLASDLDANARARFWSHVDQGDNCWEWQLAHNGAGYGSFTLRAGRKLLAHRVAYALTHGETPEGVLVCHRCDNPLCARPDHLFLGDHKTNAADMVAKGRDSHGGTRGNSHYTPEQVAAARLLSSDGLSSYAIGERVGMRPRQVRRILSGEQWARVA